MRTSQYIQPAEWDIHSAVWTAWPSDAALWLEHLGPARKEIVDFCRTIADPDPRTGVPRGENIKILANGDEAAASARASLAGAGAEVIPTAFGDIWLRDTAPIFVRSGEKLAAACFEFNGWGGKYVLHGDEDVAPFIAGCASTPALINGWVLEGGSIDVDGAGTALTTRQCLLNSNRNSGLSAIEIERRLYEALGVETLVWLGDGLVNDHTDGHIDNIARFVAPGVVVCMEPSGTQDPNRDTLITIIEDLKRAVDVKGHKLEVVTVPSPGFVEDNYGEVIPASFLNFYISNTSVIVPVYGTKFDDLAVESIAKLFPTRRTVGLPANHVITGGGSFHCITQQQPAISGMSAI
jgi:agmatine deiminase